MTSAVSFIGRSRRVWLAAATVCIAAVAPLLVTPLHAAAQVGGATPAQGTVGPTQGSSTTWTFDPVVGAGSGGTPLEVECLPGQCSRFALTVNLPEPPAQFYKRYIATLTFHCNWNSPAPVGDVDCFTFSPTGAETGPGKPDTPSGGANFEDVTVIDPPPGTWSLRADAGEVPVPVSVTGKATLTWIPAVRPLVQTRLSRDARFSNFDFPVDYQSRDGLQRANAGEPSIGIDWDTGAVLYMAGSQVTRLTYDTSTRPPTPTPGDVTPQDSVVNEDAILYTDRETNRTWSLGLLLAGSYLNFSDDGGSTWTSSVAFSPPALPDHETLGAGPYHDPAPSHSYVHAVYYCAQTIVQDAYCGRSDDGGMHFNIPASPLWGGVCAPIHGHVRVGPTGNVYVPNGSCTDSTGHGRSGVAVSVDNGQSFKVSMPPDSSTGTSDPSVMEGPDHVVYLGYQASNGHPMIATGMPQADGTIRWNPSVDVGRFQNPGEAEDNLLLGVWNTEFAEVTTGSAGRAAYAFLGTGLPGDDQGKDYSGTWYLYVSFTFDGGKHWRTVNATPHDPVQRGCIWNGGLINACRNLLDFNDIGIDKTGHVYVAYTDGCTTTADYSCDNTPGIHGWNNATSGNMLGGCSASEGDMTITSTSTCTFARVSAVVRQVCGPGLIAGVPDFNESPDCAAIATTTTPPVGVVPVTSASAAPQPPATSPALPNTAAAGSAWPQGAAMFGLLGAGSVAVWRRRQRR